ncbi:MAG TPA: S1C family serine protease [Thermodesulfobacteriota bacterium]|nr:S1C family serine protease [Thermodesulfobacteriota bacterium]
MRRSLLVVISILLILTAPAYGERSADEILKAIVKIKSVIPANAFTARILGTEREGNGVVIDSKGHILTIGYLITEAETLEVTTEEGKTISASFVGYDHDTGFGLLKANQPLKITPIKLGKSSEVKQGDPILMVGYGGTESVQAGRVIARKEFAGYWEYLLEDAIYTAPAHTGFGGAALIAPDGKLLGIGSLLTQVIIPGFGSIACNISVPIDLLPPILADLIAKGRTSAAPRPWLGLNAEEAHGRVFVVRVTSGSPAEKAGLQSEDMVLTVKGEEVRGLADFYRKVWALGSAGVEVPLGILRGTRTRDIAVKSVDRNQLLRQKLTKEL